MKIIILICACLISCAVTFAEGKDQVPSALIGEIGGERLILHIFPENATPIERKLRDTRFINVEPGCIMVEAYVKVVGEKKLEIHMPHDDGFTMRAMEKMGVSSKHVVVTFEPATGDQADAIVAITPNAEKSGEQDADDQLPAREESKAE